MDQKDIYTNLFAESFRNDPGIQMQLTGTFATMITASGYIKSREG